MYFFEDSNKNVLINFSISGWILFFVGLLSLNLGVGYLSIGFIVIGIIELFLSGMIGFKLYKEFKEQEKNNEEKMKVFSDRGGSELYNRETLDMDLKDSEKEV